MATWQRWQQEFLSAALIIDTPPNRDFLTEWARHASSPQCRDNPIDLHRKVGGSTDCDHPAGFPFWTQAYTSHANAAIAFSDQVNSNQFAAILDTLGTGNPWQDPGYQNVHAALKAWPSVNFAAYYLQRMTGGGGGGGGGGGIAPNTHKAWTDLQHSLNKVVPSAVRDSHRLRRQTLRDIGKARRLNR